MEPKFIALALLLLLLVAWARVGGRDRGPRLLLASTLGLLLGAGTIKVLLGANGYLPNTGALRLLSSVERQMHEALADPSVERILLLEGSSYSARGVDGPLLAKLMSRDGPRTAMVQVSLDGANHFERSWVLGNALRSLDPAEKARLQSVDLVLLSEIQHQYDIDPFNGFERNLHTNRTFSYMSPVNAWAGLRAVHSVGAEAPLSAWALLPSVLSHAAINAFSIGMAYRSTKLEDVSPRNGYNPLHKRKKRFRYHGDMKPVIARVEELNRTGVEPRPRLAWLAGIKEARFRGLLDGAIDEVVHYAVPSTDPNDLEYVSGFCAAPSPEPCIGYADPALLKRLDRRADWNDRRHMRVGGARKYTEWFAGRLQRVLQEQGR